MTIKFSNPGLFDIRAATTLGINVKEGSAIGFFGTGFKYAIAVLLREGQQVVIRVGDDLYSFYAVVEQVRGKDFEFIFLQKSGEAPRQLGFTTHLGKNWTLENAYRELWSNMMDEKGQFVDNHPGPHHTTIEVTGEKFQRVHDLRRDFIFYPSEHKLITENDDLAVYLGESRTIFYRGIAVGKTPKICKYTYNIKSDLSLSEDRTADMWIVSNRLRDFYVNIPDRDLVIDVLTADQELYFEATIDYDWLYINATDEKNFVAAIETAIKSKPLRLNRTAENLYIKHSKKYGKTLSYEERELVDDEAARLAEAIQFCKSAGFLVDIFPIKCASNLGENIHALANDNPREIWLAKSAFTDQVLREALLEEYIHLQFNVRDYTRKFQDILFAQIIRLAEELEDK